MTNLKKITAFALASIMALGSVASAAYVDSDDITATDAVETLTALGIIQGKLNGEFDPEGTVTRAEMAKMIFTLKNGGNDDASAFADVKTSFTDISGHWAEGYIKYCQTQGIVAGKSDTIYAPEDTVTGIEALKMTLVTVGYDALKSGLVGSGWDTKTISISSESGLTADYGQTFGVAAERQYAAQIIYNALSVDTVKYNYDYLDYQTQGQNVGEKYLNLDQDTEAVLTNAIKKGANTFITDVSAYLGEEVVFMQNNSKKTIYGVKPTGKSDAETGIIADIDSKNTIDGGDVAIDDFNAVDEYVILNGEALGADQSIDLADFDPNTSVKFVDSEGGKNADYVVINTVEVERVTYVGDETIRTTGGNEFNFDDENIDENVAKDGYVSISYDIFNEQNVVKALKLIKGDIEATRNDDFRVDGTWYTRHTGDSISIGDSVKFYTVGDYAYGIDVLDSENDAKLYVIDIKSPETAYGSVSQKIKVLFEDGTVKSDISVVEIDDKDVDAKKNAVSANEVYTYEVNNGEYKLATVGTDNDSKASYNEDTKKITADGKTLSIADTATFYVQYSDDKYAVISGSDVKGWSNQSNFSIVFTTDEVNGITVIDFAFVDFGSDKLPGSIETSSFAYVTSAPASVKVDGDNYLEVEVFNGEENVTILTDDTSLKSSLTEGTIVKYEVTSDNYADIEIISTNTGTGAVVGYNAKFDDVVIKISNSETISTVLTDDTQIFMYDVDNNKGYSADRNDIELADPDKDGKLIQNIRYGFTTSGSEKQLDFIIIGYANDIDAGNNLAEE